jgi:hypothetical protein
MKQRLQALYYAVSAFIPCWLGLVSAQMADPDLWGRLSVAALWFSTGRFPYRDVFSFTAFHHRWIDHEWLAGIVFYAALWCGGEIGLHCLKYGIIIAIYYALFSLAQKIAPSHKSLPLIIFASLFLLSPVYGDAFYPTIRAQLFSFLFFAYFIWALEQVRQGEALGEALSNKSKGLLLSLIPIGVLWANAHGGFILGLVLLLLYGLGAGLEQRSSKAALPFLLTAITMAFLIGVLNPYGFSYWPFILQALSMPRPFISEWRPLPLFTVDYWETKLLIISIGGTLLLAIGRQWKQASTERQNPSMLTLGLVALFFIGLALKGVRFKAFLALTALFYLPSLCAFWKATGNRRERNQPQVQPRSLLPALPGIAALAAALAMLVFYQPYYYARTIVQDGHLAESRGLIPFPIDMVNYLKASPYRGNLVNPFTWGEFLSWELYPRFKVAWDGRYEEVYTDTEVQTLTELYALPHAYQPQRLLSLANQSNGDLLLIEKISPNQVLMAQHPDWQLLHTDGFYFLYGRKTSLQHFPADHPSSRSKAEPLYTIGDFFHPANLNRFQDF